MLFQISYLNKLQSSGAGKHCASREWEPHSDSELGLTHDAEAGIGSPKHLLPGSGPSCALLRAIGQELPGLAELPLQVNATEPQAQQGRQKLRQQVQTMKDWMGLLTTIFACPVLS